MKFDTYIPCTALQPFIGSFALQESGDEHPYTVLPDTGLVIGFQYRGRLAHLGEGRETLLATAGISGLTDRYRTFKNTGGTGTVLVFFRPGGATAFFRQPLHELFRESLSLDHFFLRSTLTILEEQLCTAKTDTLRIAVVEQFFLSCLKHTEPDQLVLAALDILYKSKGTIRIKELARQLYTSQSPLEKRFRQAVGISPKKFASIVRMKNVLAQYDTNTSLTALGYEAGFYDQAHFIKEFRQFTGEAPEAFFTAAPD